MSKHFAAALEMGRDLRDRLQPILECEDPGVAINVLASLMVGIIVRETPRDDWLQTAAGWGKIIEDMVEAEHNAQEGGP
jgi:hypothetical protein